MAPIPETTARKVADLYRAESSALFNRARMLSRDDTNDAHDLVQQVFQEAAVNWHKLDGLDDEKRRRWLFVCLKNRAIDGWRRKHRETLQLQLLDGLDGGRSDDISDLVVSDAHLANLWTELKKMPQRQYQVIYLTIQYDWDVKDIARALEMAPSTVRVHKHNALRFIREAVANFGDDRWVG